MLGLIPTKWDLSLCNDVTASSFCRRRLPVIMVKNKTCGSVRMATKFIQQGHVRVGPQVVKDPAFIVARYVIFMLHKWGKVRIIIAATNAYILPILIREQAGSSGKALDMYLGKANFDFQPKTGHLDGNHDFL